MMGGGNRLVGEAGEGGRRKSSFTTVCLTLTVSHTSPNARKLDSDIGEEVDPHDKHSILHDKRLLVHDHPIDEENPCTP